MSFIASNFERFKDRVVVWERGNSGKRIVRDFPASYYFYIPASDGEFTAITGEKLKKLTFHSKTDFDEACLSYPKRFESDIPPLDKVMMDEYGNKPPPTLTVGMVDIEVDYDPAIPGGAAGLVANPYAPINALTMYRSDVDTYFCFAVPPQGWVPVTIVPDQDNHLIYICKDERDLLDQWFSVLDDVDLLTGWNSEFFDLPYIGKRLELVYGENGLKKLAFDRGPMPRWQEREKFKHSKEKDPVLNIGSRVHLDYMLLFKKFNLDPRQSHSLDAIATEELDNFTKIKFDMSLHDLYNKKFELFVHYNIRDVAVMVHLDKKFKYIELANNMVHEATVNFSAIFGSVQLIDTAIINYCHQKMNKIVFDRTHRQKTGVEGALVLSVKRGLHGYTASCDIQSLYPSIYRTLNLSPEMIVGQLLGYEADWKKVYQARKYPENDLNKMATVKMVIEGQDESDAIEMTVEDLLVLMDEKKLALSAYGTLLDQSGGEGLIPAVLSYWFNGRKELQALKKKHAKNADALEKDGKKSTPEWIEETRLSNYFDMLQGVRKVLLNSSYGATLNEWCRFHDPRLGASTTGSGRQVTTFMLETVTEQLIGQKIPLVKTIETDDDGEVENLYTIECPTGLGPIMADTDSCYFLLDAIIKTLPVEDQVNTAVELADAIVTHVNSGFSEFSKLAFNCQSSFQGKINANREIVAKSGIIRAKKNYTFLVVDNEGKRYDKPKLKLQGGDLKVKSTPEIVRTFLSDMTMKILTGSPRQEISDDVIKFRDSLSTHALKDPLAYATVSTVKTLGEYQEKWKRTEKVGLGKVNLPGHIRAAINYNWCLEQFAPSESALMSGAKVKIVCVAKNEWGFTTIAVPTDMERLPQWFTDRFEIDVKLTEQKMIDSKVGNTFSPIGWEIPTRASALRNKLFEFD